MTIATDLGFKIGKMYRVTDDEGSSFYKTGMIVKFEEDDASAYPWFTYISGPKGCLFTDQYQQVTIDLQDLEPLDEISSEPIKSNKDLLKLYVKQYHPLDSALIALVESV